MVETPETVNPPAAGSAETQPEPVGVWDTGENGLVWVSIRRSAVPRFSTQCPECGLTGVTINDRPAKYVDELNDVYVCGTCTSIWSPKPADTRVIRRAVVDLPVEGLEVPVEIQRVLVPYPRRDYLCPYCERSHTTRQQRRLGKPADHSHELNDVLRCPHCMKYFSPKLREATVIRS